MTRGEPFRIGPFVLTEEEVQARKKYLGIREEDEELLREAHALIHPHVDTIVERFYSYLLSHRHTRALLTATPGLLERLKKTQTRYFLELTSGRYDLAYFENRLGVGLAHERIGLSPEWYLGAYNKYLHIVNDVLSLAMGRDYERFFNTWVSLSKVIFLDMSLAIAAYIFSSQEKLAQKATALEEAYTELQELHASKRRLTDMIVHDLQNPLSGIVAFLQIHQGRPEGLADEERRALREALNRCNDLSGLILNVLQLSRAEEGKLDIYIENVNVAEIARDAVEAFSPVAEQGGRHLSLMGASSPVVARTDRSLLRRILDNLVRNALRHTPLGTRVEVSVDAGPPVAIAVRDDGPGIPRGVQGRWFDPQAVRRAGLPVDSGLGLAFCKMAADRLGARLSLESEPGKGSRFVLEVGSDEPSGEEPGDRATA
ncbi:MAG: protoglobin domain-containing protein [Acidobacteriota bacterium]